MTSSRRRWMRFTPRSTGVEPVISSHMVWFFLGNVAVVISLGAYLDSRAKKWANENIVKPLTKNGGKNAPPTLPDRFHNQDQVLERIEAKVDSQATDSARVEAKVDAQGRDLSRHLGWSEGETKRRKEVEDALWKAIKEHRR